MPYEDTVVEPGDRLNLVVGPNGSGKSSIVAAINTVLCGPLKVKFVWLFCWLTTFALFLWRTLWRGAARTGWEGHGTCRETKRLSGLLL
jgi:hypothetical protein